MNIQNAVSNMRQIKAKRKSKTQPLEAPSAQTGFGTFMDGMIKTRDMEAMAEKNRLEKVEFDNKMSGLNNSGLGNGDIIAGSDNRVTTPGTGVVVLEQGTPSTKVVNSGTGFLDGATQYKIPGAVHGTRGSTDSLIVHRTAGHGFHPNDTRLTKGGLGAHLTITRDGKVHQVGNLGDKMWHAGPKYNNRSIGMEVTGKYINGAWEPMTDLQKASVDKYGRMIVDRYKINPNNIRHHASVAAKTAGEGLLVENYLRNLYK